MKRYGNLWKRVVSWENLLLAVRKARRGKRDRAAVQRFEFDMEEHLLSLQRELVGGTYNPGGFTTHWITRPKSRMISAAPYRDRVVHHALMNVLEPILERHFHSHSYACRRGKGTHAAADRVQLLLGRYCHFIQFDIRKFFPSIDHQILKALFRRLIKDRRVLWLMDPIVDNSNEQEPMPEYFPGDDLFTPHQRRRGLPIGNLTSQWFANWYLTGLDHCITSRPGLGGYVRYCDDFIICHHDRDALLEAAASVRSYLAGLRLRLHSGKLQVKPSWRGLTFVGYRIWASHRLVRKSNVREFRRRVRWMRRAYAAGIIDWNDIKPRLASWIGHARQADSERLLRRLCREWKFMRDRATNVPCSARRQLEQQREQLPVRQPQQEHARQPEQQHRLPCCRALFGGSLPSRPESCRLRAA
jgi:retron-type reverse transcriptase